MDFSNDNNLFAANSERFFVNSAYIQNEWRENDWKDILQPNQTTFSERNWLEMTTDKSTVIMDEPDINLGTGDITTKIEIDESDFMHIAIDGMKTEWSNELNLPTFPEANLSTWIPPIFQPESPLPPLSNFTFSDILANLPPVSPPVSPPLGEEPIEHFLPENFSLLKEENPQSANQPLDGDGPTSLTATVEWPLSLSIPQDTGDDNTPTKDSLSALLIPSIDTVAKPASTSYTNRFSDEDGDEEKNGATQSDSSWQWHDSSDEEFGKKFEREEHIELILQNYHRGGINTDDNSIYCDLCNRKWSQKCPHHGKLKTHIKNRQVPMGTKDRAIKTAPHFLSVLKSKIRGANKGVWTSKTIPRRTYFGPYEGCVVPVDHPNAEYCWKVIKDGKAEFLVDGSDPNKSNWMRYVNCARTADEQNLEAFQYRQTIYYRTTKNIKAKDELLVWYGYKYAKKMGIRWRDFVESNPSNKTGVVFPCDMCFHVYANPILTEQHKKRHHPLVSSKDPLKVAISSKRELSPSNDANSSICMEVTTGDKPITCGVCGARFRRRGRPLQNHMKEHNDQNHHCCSRCGQWFPTALSLDQHRTAFSKARKNKTGDVICGADFKVRQKRTGTKQIIPNQPHTNEFRSKTAAKSAEQLFLVTKKAERDTSKFSLCDKCGALFRRKCLLFAHLENRHDVIPAEKKVMLKKRRFKCVECGVSYRERSTLKSHLKIHEEQTSESEGIKDTAQRNKELLFSCEICATKFRAEITLKYHSVTHEGAASKHSKSQDRKENAPKIYKCKECKMRFRPRSTLDLHVKTHKKERQMKHLMATSRLRSPLDEPARHGSGESISKGTVQVHSKDAQKRRLSLNEGGYLASEERLRRDIDDVSENAPHKKRRRISSMECLACGFIFKDRSALDAHVLKHTNEKIWVCNLNRLRIPL